MTNEIKKQIERIMAEGNTTVKDNGEVIEMTMADLEKMLEKAIRVGRADINSEATDALNKTFGYQEFVGHMTSRQLKRCSEHTAEYQGYTIAFSKYYTDKSGRTCWSVDVWKNDGNNRHGAFKMTCHGCAANFEAMGDELRWARYNIDRLLAA